MHRTYAAAVLFVISIGLIAQNTTAQGAKEQNSKGQNPASAKPKLTEQQKRGTSLLESAEGAAGGLPQASRIVAYLQIAQVYRVTDKKKALELTERAYESARTLQPDSTDENEKQVEQQLQEQVIDQYILLSPEKVDSDLDQMPAALRAHALQSLLAYYWKNKNSGRPVAVLMQLALETEMDYNIATDVIEKLPQHSEQVRELFVAALTSYQNHEHRAVSSGGFTETIAAAYGHVPDQLVASAIDEVLSQAKEADDESSKTKRIQMRFGLKDAVEFTSYYDLQLFNVLSVLQQIDPEKAQRLLNERQAVKTFASKYPEGVGALRKSGLSSLGVTEQSGSAGVPGSSEALEQQRSNQIVESSAAHPNDAIANAALLSPQFALQAYMGIARENMKKNVAAASMALHKAQDVLPQVPVFEQIHTVSDIIYSYEQLGDKDAARSAVADGVKTAAALYKQDSDASDPNTAPEAYWVSTKVWRNLMEAAYELDPNIAMSLLPEVPDDQLRVFTEVALAGRFLGSKVNIYDIAMSVHKQGGAWTMFSSPAEPVEEGKK